MDIGTAFLGGYIWIFILLWALLCPIVSGILASRKNRNVVGWIVFSIFFGLIAVIIIAVLPPKEEGEIKTASNREEQKIWAIIWAIIFFTILFFLLVSLISFDVRDCPWMYYPTQVPVKNWTGKFGAYTSGALISLFGLGSYILVAILGAWGRNVLKEKNITRSNAFGIGILLLVSCAFLDVLPFNLLGKLGNYNGGLFGRFFTDFLSRYFGKFGSYIILGALFVLSILLITEFSLFHIKREKKQEKLKESPSVVTQKVINEVHAPISAEPIITGTVQSSEKSQSDSKKICPTCKKIMENNWSICPYDGSTLP